MRHINLSPNCYLQGLKFDRLRKASLVLSICAGASIPALGQARNTPPPESIGAHNANNIEVVTPPLPPAGFNPLTASDQELEKFNLPPRPDPVQAPNEYARWQKMVTIPQTQSAPVVQQTTIRHRLPQSYNYYERSKLDNSNVNVGSTNWSGYAGLVPNGTFASQNASITAQITVPTVTAATCNSNWEYSSQWVGFDGVTSSDVLQAGIEADAVCSGTATSEYYGAWFEWYPNYSYRLTNFSIAPGDTIDVQVWYTTTAPNGHAYFANYQTGVSGSVAFYIPGGVKFEGNSVEWILEQPEVNGSQAVLPDYVSDTFNSAGASSTASGSVSPGSCADCSSMDNIEMVSSSNVPLTTVTLSGKSTILFTQPGKTTPTPPSCGN
ncbi:MAG: G1 family glutamic endopeptidase [Methylomonas sp.]